MESCSQILKSDMKFSISQKWDQSIKMCEVSKRPYGQERKGLASPGHGGKVSLGEDGPGTRAPPDGPLGGPVGIVLLCHCSSSNTLRDSRRNRPLTSKRP